MIQLDRFYRFINALEYVGQKSTNQDRYYFDVGYHIVKDFEDKSFEETGFLSDDLTTNLDHIIIDGDIDLWINGNDAAIMEKHIINIEQYRKQAEVEVLNSLYLIPKKQDKTHFLTYIYTKFLERYTHYMNYDFIIHVDNKNLMKADRLEYIDLYLTYFDCCLNEIFSFTCFFKKLLKDSCILINSNELKDPPIYDLFDAFKINENIQENDLKKYFKTSAKYDLIMLLPCMINYLKQFGGNIHNIPKGDKAAFLITLLNNGYFPFSYKKELKKVGEKVYGVTRAIDDGNDKQRLDLFSFIPKEEDL